MCLRPRTVHALMLVAAVAACEPGSVASPSTLADVPAPSFAEAPPPISGNSNGAIVARFTNAEFMLEFDAAHGLMTAHMPSTICTEPGLTVVDVQRVTKPSQVGPVVSHTSAEEAAVAVYRTNDPSDAGVAATVNSFFFGNVVDFDALCAFLRGPQRIAEGSVRRTTTFSAASFHGTWTGTIQGVDGQDYHLTEVYQLNADAHDPNNPDTFFEPVVTVRLEPVP